MAHATILIVDLPGLAQKLVSKLDSRSNVAVAIDDPPHAIQRPKQIHGCGATRREVIAQGSGLLNGLIDGGTASDERLHTDKNRISSRDPNRRCSAHSQGYNRLVGLLDALNPNHLQRFGQKRLVQ
jgi:hypothetical protein